MTRNVGQKKLKPYAMNLKQERNGKIGFALQILQELWLLVHRCFGLTIGNFLRLVEESNPQGIIVADEQCSGERILNDPVGVDEWSMDDMLNAIGERYLMASTCPCFTSKDGNEDRINWLLNKVKEWKIQGVIYYVVRGCMLYAMEYTRVKKALDKINVPVYYLDTEYTTGRRWANEDSC